MGKLISVVSTKGGPGKSTLSRLISIVAASKKLNVCIIDTCHNSSIATGFFADRDVFKKTTFDWLTNEAKLTEVIQQYKDTNIYYIPSNRQISEFDFWFKKNVSKVKQLNYLRTKVIPLLQKFDLVVIDTHPSEDNELVNLAISSSDYVLIPSEVDEDSVLAAERT